MSSDDITSPELRSPDATTSEETVSLLYSKHTDLSSSVALSPANVLSLSTPKYEELRSSDVSTSTAVSYSLSPTKNTDLGSSVASSQVAGPSSLLTSTYTHIRSPVVVTSVAVSSDTPSPSVDVLSSLSFDQTTNLQTLVAPTPVSVLSSISFPNSTDLRSSVTISEAAVSSSVSSKTTDMAYPVASSLADVSSFTSSENDGMKCYICNRVFESNKGLRIHLNTCRKSLSENTIIPTKKGKMALNDNTLPEQGRMWGNLSFDDLQQVINATYEEIVFWKKNLFKLPSGSAGKRYIRETTRLIDVWNANAAPMNNIALKLIMVMPTLLLQKPFKNSSSKQHTEYLIRRMNLWEKGDFDEILKESRAIQNKMKQIVNKNDNSEHLTKTFSKLMLQGKVHAALRLLDK